MRRVWRARWGRVLWPLLTGLAFCALALWSALAYSHNQSAFRAHALPAKAVIDQIYASAPFQTSTGSDTFDEYALVRFGARGETARARVLLISGCIGTCPPKYHAGQALTVYYSPQNLNYAQLPSSVKRPSSDVLTWVILSGFLGVVFLAAAVINAVTA